MQRARLCLQTDWNNEDLARLAAEVRAEYDRAEKAEARAESEKARAESEKVRADKAEALVDLKEARIRKMARAWAETIYRDKTAAGTADAEIEMEIVRKVEVPLQTAQQWLQEFRYGQSD